MKPLLILLCLLPFSAHAWRGVTLAWSFNPPHEGVTNYVFHIGTTPPPAAFSESISVGNTNRFFLRMPGTVPEPGDVVPSGVTTQGGPKYYLALTAQGIGGESTLSTVVTWTNVPSKPKDFRIFQTVGTATIQMGFTNAPAHYVLATSTNLIDWEPILQTVNYRPDLWPDYFNFSLVATDPARFYSIFPY